MSWTFMQSFSFIPLMASEKKIFRIFFFENLAFWLPWQPKSTIWTKFIWLVEDYSRNISIKLFQNICSNTEINADLHFSHYKSMETLSCHNNQSAWATAIKSNLFVEAIVRNNSAKFQLYLPNSFWGVDFWIFFLKFCLLVAMVTNQIKKLRGYNKKRYVL